MKYKVIIELEEDRYTCTDCPLCDCFDNCRLQPEENQEVNSWDKQLLNCPLEIVD